MEGITIAYAKRNPLAILTVPDEVSTKLEAVLNLPFKTTTANDFTNKESTDTNGPDEPTKPTDWRDTIDLGHIENNEMRTKILTMVRKHKDMRKAGRLREITDTEHRITLETGTKPILSMPYRQGPEMRTKAEAEIRKMRDAGVVEPATPEWASPIVLVPKKDGSLQFCIDYRRLNAKAVPDAFPLPRTDDCLDSLGDAEIFTTLDCNVGYWQVPVAPEDRNKTTFTWYLGTFRYTRMPFGLRNAPATFQRALNIILSVPTEHRRTLATQLRDTHVVTTGRNHTAAHEILLLSTKGRLSRTHDYPRKALGCYGEYEIVCTRSVSSQHCAVTLVSRSRERIS